MANSKSFFKYHFPTKLRIQYSLNEILVQQKWVEFHYFKLGKIKFWTFLARPKSIKIDILDSTKCELFTFYIRVTNKFI